MAVNIVPETWSKPLWEMDHGAGSMEIPEQAFVDQVYPYPSFSGDVASSYMNKVWDTVAGGWVFWATDFEDVDGTLYRGPGVFGVNTSHYRVESIEFDDANQ